MQGGNAGWEYLHVCHQMSRHLGPAPMDTQTGYIFVSVGCPLGVTKINFPGLWGNPDSWCRKPSWEDYALNL